MKKLVILFSILIFSITIWFQRSIFFQTYDHAYMHDFYSLSQWAMPLSSRIMGDADLYKYSGYKLVFEYKPFSVSPEVPPLMKLLYGYSSYVFNNPYLVSVFFTLLLLILVDNLATSFFSFSKLQRITLATLIFSAPLIQYQYSETMLDLPQLVFFVAHILFLFYCVNRKKYSKFFLIISGVSLGLMSVTKFPLYTPIILLADSYYLYKNKKSIEIPFLYIITGITYLLFFIPEVLSTGILGFLKTQKWVINFYLSSDVIATKGMILITSFSGFYKGWWNNTWEHLSIWNGSWGIGILSMIYSGYKSIHTKTKFVKENQTLLFTLIAIFFVLLILPFWTRYLIIFIPFFWIFCINLLQKNKMFLFFLLFPVITTTQLVYNSFQLDLNYRNFWEKGNYEELYNYLDASIKQTTNRQEFVKSHLDEYENINPYKIEFKQVAEEKSLTQIKERVQVSLIGYNKSLEKEIQLTWKREFGNWKIATLETLNTVETKTDAQLSLLCINPVKVTDWSKTYIATGTILNITPETVSQRVMKLTPRNYCIPIGIVGDTLKLDNNNGIEIIHETNPQ